MGEPWECPAPLLSRAGSCWALPAVRGVSASRPWCILLLPAFKVSCSTLAERWPGSSASLPFWREILQSTNSSYLLLVLQAGSRCTMEPSHTQWFCPTSAGWSWKHLGPTSDPVEGPCFHCAEQAAPQALHFIFAIRVQPLAQANTKHKCSSPYLYHPWASEMHFIYKIEKGKEKKTQKLYFLRRKREQLRTWMLLLPLSMNW